MNQKIIVHERVMERHPEIGEDDVIAAWKSRVKCQVRIGPWPPQYAAVGFDGNGRAIEMAAVYDLSEDTVLVFHADTPPKKSMRRELGIE